MKITTGECIRGSWGANIPGARRRRFDRGRAPRRVGFRSSFGVLLGLVLPAATAAQETAKLSGKVFLESDAKPPRANLLKQMTDAKCSEQHDPKKGVGSEDLIARDTDPRQDRTFVLQNVIVYVSSGMSGKSFPVPEEVRTLDQKGCMYKPHVVTLQVGQKLDIVNSDPLAHNVHGLPEKNPPFNLSQNPGTQKETRTFKKPEIFKVKCEVHGWMSAWIGVFDHPFHAVTNEKGDYELAGLPPGEYEITAWHEKLGAVTQKVTVPAGVTVQNFTFKMNNAKEGDARPQPGPGL